MANSLSRDAAMSLVVWTGMDPEALPSGKVTTGENQHIPFNPMNYL